MVHQLATVNLLNLQLLNISNNNLNEITISNHNFPKLKELYCSYNKFTTAKFFSKIDTLKLLDLSYNLISSYEEILCLAFQEGLVVLNLINNPLHIASGEDVSLFEKNIKQILPKVMLLNPKTISKVSCFENFKDLAFSVG
jgi:Leucine-rich repeat (LRR) protein